MKNGRTFTILLVVLLTIVGLCSYSMKAGAGSLEPNEPPGPTMHTIEEVYGAVKIGAGPIMAGDERWVGSLVLTGYPGSYNIGNDPNVLKVVDLYQDCTAPSGGPSIPAALSPVTVTMNIDKSSPKFWQRACDGQVITDPIDIKLYKSESDSDPYYTLKLETVKVSKMASRMVYKGNGKYSHLDVVDLDYERITWKWEPSGPEFTYDKASP